MTVPMYGLNFQMPAEGWVAWSSFPSDHAALFFLLTVCLFSVSRILGSIALADTIFLICLPRVVLGVHYPTDIVCGAFIGIAAGYLVLWKRVRVPISKPMLQWMNAHPPSFYASAFLVTFLFAQVFWPVTQIIIKLKRLVMVLIK